MSCRCNKSAKCHDNKQPILNEPPVICLSFFPGKQGKNFVHETAWLFQLSLSNLSAMESFAESGDDYGTLHPLFAYPVCHISLRSTLPIISM